MIKRGNAFVPSSEYYVVCIVERISGMRVIIATFDFGKIEGWFKALQLEPAFHTQTVHAYDVRYVKCYKPTELIAKAPQEKGRPEGTGYDVLRQMRMVVSYLAAMAEMRGKGIDDDFEIGIFTV